MIIVKCPKKDCKGHLVGFNSAGIPALLPNRDHAPENTPITPEIRAQLNAELNSEPFATFMDVVKEATEKKKAKTDD